MSRKLVSGGKYLIVSVDSGKLLRVKHDSDKDDARIVQSDPMDRDIKTREWRLEKLSNNTCKLRNIKTGKYLSVKTDSKEDGTEIVQKKRDESTKQRLRITQTKKGDFRIEIIDDQRRRKEEEERRDDRLREDRTADDMERRDRLDEMETRRVLEVESGAKKDGARIIQWRLTGERNQRFRLISVDTKSKL